MELDGILLRTMREAENADQWEEKLKQTIGSVAGDDQSLCMAAFGFNSFDEIKRYFYQCYITLHNRYLAPVSILKLDDRVSRMQLWLQYKPVCCRYMEAGVEDVSP